MENKAEAPLKMDLKDALSSTPTICLSEPGVINMALPPCNTDETSGIQDIACNTLSTEADKIDDDVMSDDNEWSQIVEQFESLTINMKLTIIVSMVAPYSDSAETLIHTGDFILEATPTTTIRNIKYGITGALEICYEDMALLFLGKFLSDSRTLAYYKINDGQTLHLLVETPNKLFKDVFEVFKKVNLSEERAWFATRNFINVMDTKYFGPTGIGNGGTSVLTEELLQYELEQLHVPDSDDSDDSSADEMEPNILASNNLIVGGSALEFMNFGDLLQIEEEQYDSENDEQNTQYTDNNDKDETDYTTQNNLYIFNNSDDNNSEYTTDDENDDNFNFLAQVMAHFCSLE